MKIKLTPKMKRLAALLSLCLLLPVGAWLFSPSPRTAFAQTHVDTELIFTYLGTTPGDHSGQDHDGDPYIEPGESAEIAVLVKNRTRFSGTSPSGLHSSSIHSNTAGIDLFPDDPEYAENLSVFLCAAGSGCDEEVIYLEFHVDPSAPCGVEALFELDINLDAEGTETISGRFDFSVPLGQPSGSPTVFSYTGPSVAIPDNKVAGVNIPINVSGLTSIADINFRFDGDLCSKEAGATTVGLDHTKVGDLVVKLTSPQGITVALMQRPGGAANSGRNFCRTVLDENGRFPFNEDGGFPLIQLVKPGEAPYNRTFLPSNPLMDAFSGFRNIDPNGTWILNVSDRAAGNTGHVRKFSLIIDPVFECRVDTPHQISGRVTTDGTTGLSGVTMRWTRADGQTATATTDENGHYQFVSLSPGFSYTVVPRRVGYEFNPVRKDILDLNADKTADFIATEASYLIAGRITKAGTNTGLEGLTLKLSGSRQLTTTTDANGIYRFQDVPAAGFYTVKPVSAYHNFTPAKREYLNLSADQASQDYTAQLKTFTISGQVKFGAGTLSGVALKLTSPTPAGFAPRTVYSNSAGNYTFTNVPIGRNYTLTATKAGYQFIPSSKSLPNLSANQTDVNFVVKVHTIHGRVVRTGTTTGIGAVTMTLTSPTPSGFAPRKAQTTTNGYYTFANVPAGRNYTIKPAKSGYTFSPATRSITNLSGNIPVGPSSNFSGTGP
jgi:subtilisin-like proprotein convertase family protein